MTSPDELNRKLEKLEDKLKANFFEIEKRLVNLESPQEPTPGLNEKIEEIEDLLLLVQLENVKMKDALKQEPLQQTVPEDIEERLTKLEQRGPTEALTETPSDTSDIETKIDELDEKISSIKLQKAGAPEELVAEIKELKDKVNSLEQPARAEPDFSTQDKKLEQMKEEIQELKEEIKEKPGKPVSGKGMEHYIQKVESLKSELEDLLEERKSFIEKIEKSEEDAEKIDTALIKLKTVEERITTDIDKARDLQENIDDVKKSIDDKINNFEERLGAVQKSLENKVDTTDEIKKHVDEKVTSLEDKFSALKNDIGKKSFSGSDDKIKELEKKIEEKIAAAEGISTKDLEKRLDELHVKIGVSEVDKRLEMIEQEIKKIDNMQRAIDDEFVQRMSIEKRLQDMDKSYMGKFSKLGGITAKAPAGKETEIPDMVKLQKELQEQKVALAGLEKHLDIEITKHLSSHLENFAKELDKRIPELITKTEYRRDADEIKQKIQTIESPDLSPLAQRVGDVEKKLEQIIKMMQGFSTRLPVVVE